MSSDRIRPRKRFGQHFLHAPSVVARIVAAIAPAPGQPIIEIGPGTGILTRALLEHDIRLTVIELDRDLAAGLRESLGPDPRFRLVESDALKVDLATLYPGERVRVVGNLPYNVSTPLLFHCLRHAAIIEDMHFMLQREVVDRIVARPATSAYGRLTVGLALVCDSERVLDVGPGAFHPPPRVESAVVRLRVLDTPRAEVHDRAGFAALVAHLFSRRRKTLRAALRGLIDEAAIRAAGIEPGARAETLAVADLARLANRAAPGLFTDPVDKSVRKQGRGRQRREKFRPPGDPSKI